jgi:protein-S-isoprenylcysteine O-methyltransferase Ste14
MDEWVRYYMALVLVVSLPPLLLVWVLIHPFISFWRRLGPALTYTLVGTVVGLGVFGLVQVRLVLLAVELGTDYFLVALGVLCLGGSTWLWVLLHRQLTMRTLLGLPELAPARYPAGLLTEGLYARVRHPRYVQLILNLWGLALIANYPASYVAVALWLPGIYVIVRLEERELRDRFGAAYDDYCRRTPRFVPKFKGNPT